PVRKLAAFQGGDARGDLAPMVLLRTHRLFDDTHGTFRIGFRMHHLAFPIRSAISAKRWTCETQAFFKSLTSRLSFSPCAFVYGYSTPIRSAGAPPRASANGFTNGIDPPHPIRSGSTPYPFFIEESAASNAGPTGSIAHAVPPVEASPDRK